MNTLRNLALTLLIFGIYLANLFFSSHLAAQSSVDKPLDLVLIIDHSGSMVNPKFGRSDPFQMRFLAARLLIDLLNDDDRVGLVLFSSDAQDMSNGLQLLQTGRDRLKDRIADMEQQPTGDQTSYRKALQVASNLFDASSSDRQPVVIFLTDGAPTDLRDEADYRTVLQPFVDQKIPVYLLMLEPKEFNDNAVRNDTLNRINNTLQIFRTLRQPVIEISDPASIARAFAQVITNLQPSVYIDVESPRGNPDRNQTIFSSSIAATQRLTDVTFVFYETKGSTSRNLVTNNVRAPSNAQQVAINNGGRYITARYRAATGRMIEGEWQFTVNAPADAMSAFTFFRSDVRIRPRYPSPNNPAALRDQPVLLGASIDGLATDQIPNVRLRVNFSRCPLERREQAADRVLGVEQGIDNVVWSQLSDFNRNADYFYVTVEYAPPNALTIWKCFAVKLLPPDPALKIAITSLPADLAADGSFELTAQLPANIKQAYAIINGPNNVARQVVLDQGHANSGRLPFPGEYTVRVIAELSHAGFDLALFDQRTQKFASIIRLNTNESVTSFVGQSLNQSLKGIIVLDAPLVTSSDEVRFQVETILRDNQPANAALNIDLCSGGVVLADEQVRCPFQITLPSAIEPGQYLVDVKVTSDVHNVLFQSVKLDITVPAPGVNLRVPGGTLQFDAPITRLRQTAATNELEVIGFFIEQLPDLKFTVEMLRDMRINQTYPPSFVRLTPSQTFGDGLVERYRFDVSFAEELPSGQYEIRVRLSTDQPVAINQPTVVITGVKRSVAVRLAATTDAPATIWGFWLPFWQPTTTIPLTATVFFDNQLPENYPPPTIRSIQHDNDRYLRDTFTINWQDTERVNNDTFIRTAELRLNRFLFFDGGLYEVVLESDAAFDPDNVPQPIAVQVQVYGWWEYLWRALAPALVSLWILHSILGIPPRRHGKILINNEEVMEEDIEFLPFRKIKFSSQDEDYIIKLGSYAILDDGTEVKYAYNRPFPVRLLGWLIANLFISLGFAMLA